MDTPPTGSEVCDGGTVAELKLLSHNCLGLGVSLHGHVTESILGLREQTEQIKDADGVGVAHSVGWVADELNIPHQRTSGAFGGHLGNWHSDHVNNHLCDILRITRS